MARIRNRHLPLFNKDYYLTHRLPNWRTIGEQPYKVLLLSKKDHTGGKQSELIPERQPIDSVCVPLHKSLLKFYRFYEQYVTLNRIYDNRCIHNYIPVKYFIH